MAFSNLDPSNVQTHHYETGPDYRLACWCDIGHDHTFAEFAAFHEDNNA